MKRIILCADDYGQNSAISQAIVELLKAKRLSATSCLVTPPAWEQWGSKLVPYKEQADVGLHLNLTQGKPLTSALESFFTLNNLLLKANLRMLDKAAITQEFNAQFDKFVAVTGDLPDFLDGHQHIHQFPVIRDVVIELYNAKLRASSAYMRSTFDPATLYRVQNVAYFKQLFIQFSGGIAFRKKIDNDGIPHNATFAGIYNFADTHAYAEFFPRFLKKVNDGGIIMCHPGMMGTDGDTDEIIDARHNEYNYFSSHAFMKLCADNHIRLVRFRDLVKK